MARVISFEGRKISVPDDATDDEVAQIIEPQSAPESAPEAQTNTFGDVVRSIPGGLAKGVAAVAGLPGDVQQWITGGTRGTSLPTSKGIGDAISAPFGGFYEPKTPAGEYADTIASFAPAAIAPGGIAAKVGRVAVPAVASETAGQATKGTAAEPYARVIGALAGGSITGAAEGIAAARKAPKVPTTQELKTQGSNAYQAAEQAGVIVSKSSFKNMVSNLEKDLADAAIDQTLHPKAIAALKRLQDTNDNVTLKGIDVLRRVANGAASSADKDERRIARIIKDAIDEYVDGLTPADLVAGDASKAVGELKRARELWSKATKGDTIETIIQKAKDSSSQFSGSGYENALRTQFRGLAKNERSMRRFNKEEQAAIRKVANGGPVENTLRLFGKLAPTGIVSGGIGTSLGYAAGGPAGAVALPAVGLASRAGATAMTARNARAASELMRRGGPAPSNALATAPAYDAALAAPYGRQERLNESTYADQIRSLSQIP